MKVVAAILFLIIGSMALNYWIDYTHENESSYYSSRLYVNTFSFDSYSSTRAVSLNIIF